jgi:hypothetical protein
LLLLIGSRCGCSQAETPLIALSNFPEPALFDSFSLLLKRDAHSQLVYKHSISTIMPAEPVRLFEEEDKAEPEARAPLVQISPRVIMPADHQD